MTSKTNIELLKVLGILVSTLPPSQRLNYSRKVLSVASPVSEHILLLLDTVKQMLDRNFSRVFETARRQFDTLCQENIVTLVIGEESYPLVLAHIYDPPTCLYIKGSLSEHFIQQNKIAIVGSRRSNKEGEETAFLFAKALAEQDVSIVSGLALGIDSAAHKGALTISAEYRNTCPTIGVLGSGFNKFYPPYNRELGEKILSNGGLIISQFLPDTPPYPANFLNRNRIIAGLSRATIVIQATAKSGSLATARFCIEEGRELFVVPGGIYDPRYEGSLQLLKQGSHLVTSVEDIFEALNIKRSLAKKVEVSNHSSVLFNLIQKERRIHIDEMKRRVPEINNIEEQLIALELSGVIEREPGNFIRICNT